MFSLTCSSFSLTPPRPREGLVRGCTLSFGRRLVPVVGVI
jgi:hypothetical protein